jgi:hypothetical protein
MSLLSPLLDIQEIDRACDRLRARRRDLPERAEKAKVEARIARVDAAHAELERKREAVGVSEHELADQVGEVAARAKKAEDTLYGGTVKAAKDLAALQEEIDGIRASQARLEEQEMELLEEIDGIEGEMAENRSARDAGNEELAEVVARLQAAEAAIDDEIAALGRDKAIHAGSLPAPVLDAYEALRGHEKLLGVAAAAFTEKGCGGCNMQLPRLEVSRMREQPDDALLYCENCGRLLVR